jgi:hypothetical protein
MDDLECYEIRDCMIYVRYSIVMLLICMRLLWAGHVNKMEKAGNVYRILMGESLGKRSLQDREDDERIQ